MIVHHSPHGRIGLARNQPLFAYWALVAFVLTLQFSPITGLIGYRITGDSGWSVIGIARDAIVILLGTVVLMRLLLTLRISRHTHSVTWAIFTLIVIGVLAILSTADLASIALNLRRLLMFPLILLTVAGAQLSQNQIVALLRFILNTTVLVAVFGVLEYFAPNSFWRDYLRVTEYYSSNPFDPFGTLPFEETGRFFSWDLQGLFGGPIRRSVSTYLEPTTLAAAFMCGICLAASECRSGQPGAKFRLFIILACGILTISKFLGLFLIVLIMYIRFKVPSPRWIFSLTITGAISAFWAQSVGFTEGKFEHIVGLATAIRHVRSGYIFGEGLGNAGNYAALGSDMEVGAESGLGNLIAQIGLASLVYLFWIQSLAKDVIRRSSERGDRIGVYFASMLLGWFISFMLSASSLGIGGNALVFLALGLYLHKNCPYQFTLVRTGRQ